MWNPKLICKAFIFFLIFSQGSLAQVSLEEAISKVLANQTNQNQPGCAISVIKDGQTIYRQGFGMANLEHSIVFKPETVSDIGSVAKQFTCMAILLLKEQGKLSLDDKLSKYFGNLDHLSEDISIQHLINHTSGIREIYTMLSLGGMRTGDGIQQHDALDLLKRSKGLNFKPGSEYMYCNTAYMLLADIVSIASGQEFEPFMQEQIFRPLGMNHTYIMDEHGELHQNCADSYAKNEDGSFRKIYDNSTAYGQGGIYSSSLDMEKWMNNFFDKHVGSKSTHEEMLKRGVLSNGDTLAYAAGLRFGTRNGIAAVGHGGASAGFRCLFEFFPEENIGIIIRTNSAGFDFNAIVDAILSILLAEGYTIKVEDPVAEGNENLESAYPNTDKKTQFTGKFYCADLDQYYTIKEKDEGLVLEHVKAGKFPLKQISPTEFTAESWFLSNLVFEMNKKGGIQGFSLNASRIRNVYFEKIEK